MPLLKPFDLGCLFGQTFDQSLPFDGYRICLWTFWNVNEYEIVRRRMIWNIRGDFGAEVIGSSGLGYAALR